MNRNLLGGAALAAIVAASPAVAQQPNPALCSLDTIRTMAPGDPRLRQIDTDGDGRLTTAEYQACLDANVPAEQRQTHLQQFQTLDTDRDQIVVLAELSGTGTAQQTQTAGARPAEVNVQEQAANVDVLQPAPTVEVTQAQPRVAVQQPEPEVAVQQRQPEVRVQQPEPEVSVRQPEPQVEVQQPEAQVAIEQPAPQVAMNVPPPEVEVQQAEPQVSVEQVQPEVSVEQPEPEVRVEQAEANIDVQTEEPRIIVNKAEPEVVVERVSEPELRTSEATPPAPAQVASNTGANEPAVTTDTSPMTAAVPFDDIEGEDVYNRNGNEIGQISEVVMEQASGSLFVVVTAGGFLGIGNTEIVFPYERVSLQDNRVVIDTSMSQGQLEERQDYEESRYVEVPEDRVVR